MLLSWTQTYLVIDCTAGEGENVVHSFTAPILAASGRRVGGGRWRKILLVSKQPTVSFWHSCIKGLRESQCRKKELDIMFWGTGLCAWIAQHISCVDNLPLRFAREFLKVPSDEILMEGFKASEGEADGWTPTITSLSLEIPWSWSSTFSAFQLWQMALCQHEAEGLI